MYDRCLCTQRTLLEGPFRKGVLGDGKEGHASALLKCFAAFYLFIFSVGNKNGFTRLSSSFRVLFWKGLSQIMKEGKFVLPLSFGAHAHFPSCARAPSQYRTHATVHSDGGSFSTRYAHGYTHRHRYQQSRRKSDS